MTITYLAKTNFRNQNQTFGIKQKDRLSHSYILGKTGTGKSTLLFNMIYQDLCNFQGFVLLDPHGELADKVVNNIPEFRKDDVTYLDVSDLNLELGYNPLGRVSKENRALVVSGIIEILKKLHDKKSWGVKMEHILRNVLFTLLDQEQADLSCISKILLDKAYRQSCIKNITNDEVKRFWTDEYDKYHQFTKANMISPILNKLSAFLTSPVARNILVNNKKQISFRKIMDQKKVVIINLAKGKTGEDVSSLLGGLLLHSIALASFSRSNISEENREDFFVYVDEFQSFTTLSIANMLSELRKYKTGLILANQYLYQLDNQIKEAVLGNVGTLISFRLGVKDATYMQKEFYPKFDFNDITNLPNYHIYLKLLIDGNPSKAFSAKTIYNYKLLKKY